jgi:signal transduction histidine kinase
LITTLFLKDRLLPARDDLGRSLHALVEIEKKLQAKARVSADRLLWVGLRILLALGSIAIGVSLLLAWLFTRRLSDMFHREKEASALARKATEAREELLAVVAYDLRNPLNSIVLKSSLLKEHPESKRAQEAAASIGRVAMRMDDLIDDLLVSARVDAGRLLVSVAPCTVLGLFQDTLEVFGELAKRRNTELAFRLDEEDLLVLCDRRLLLRVMGNLVANALKFAPEGSEVSIQVWQFAGRIRFAVQDHGPGVAREKLGHLFERFWKGSSREGSGLGLFIAKGIVEAHGGSIWVQSLEGWGSTFVFDIPAAPRVIPRATVESRVVA